MSFLTRFYLLYADEFSFMSRLLSFSNFRLLVKYMKCINVCIRAVASWSRAFRN